jgi:serine phosphatase RsbU (regulator of sigma subunit)
MGITGLSLDELATRMNQHHWQDGEEARRKYVTAIFMRLYPGEGELEVVNAGHNPGIVMHADGSTCLFEAAGTPLGLLPGMRYTSERCGFAPGSRLLFYTDGLTEAFRGDEEFGTERLMANFSQVESTRADDILDALWTAIGTLLKAARRGTT